MRILKRISINDFYNNPEKTYEYCIFEFDVIIVNREVTFESCEFVKKVKIFGGTGSSNFEFCRINEIELYKGADTLWLMVCIINRFTCMESCNGPLVQFFGGVVQYIQLNGSIDRVFLNGGLYGWCKVGKLDGIIRSYGSSIVNLEIEGNQNDSVIDISNTSIHTLEFDSVYDGSQIFIRGLEKELELQAGADFKSNREDDSRGNFESYLKGKNEIYSLLCSRLSPPMKIEIKSSDMSGVTFFSTNFEKYNVWSRDSFLESIRLINSKLPRVFYYDNQESGLETYRQMRLNSQKNSNTLFTHHYYQKEMNILLSVERGFDKFLLLSGKVISNHLTDWVQALLAYFLLSLVFGLGVGLLDFNIPINFLSIFSDLIELMYPLSSYEDFLGLKGGKPLFYIYKIFSGIILYQLVVSFRKFNRKF